MKRKVLLVASLFLATATFAQDGLTSKKGEAYLPEAGDWSIGFDVTALTSFVGNAFNGAGNNIDTNGTLLEGTGNSLNAGGWMNGTIGQEIRFKMFKDETTAYRLRARIGFSGSNSDAVGKWDHDGDALTEDQDYKVNTKNSNGFSVVLGAGLEKRRGNTRIQGYYGGEVMFGMIGGTSTTIDDGRGLSDTYTNGGAARTTKVSNGSTIAFGLQGFMGVEWFFAPKVSVGAEYTWGLVFSSTGEQETSTERWGTAFGAAAGTADTLQEETNVTEGASGSMSLDTGGQFALNLQFHF
jgi:hypothetical protein